MFAGLRQGRRRRFNHPGLAEHSDQAQPGDRLCAACLDRLSRPLAARAAGNRRKPRGKRYPVGQPRKTPGHLIRPPANSHSTSSLPLPTSIGGSSPSARAMASLPPGNGDNDRGGRRWIRRSFPPSRSSSRQDCCPAEPQDNSASAEQQLQDRCRNADSLLSPWRNSANKLSCRVLCLRTPMHEDARSLTANAPILPLNQETGTHPAGRGRQSERDLGGTRCSRSCISRPGELPIRTSARSDARLRTRQKGLGNSLATRQSGSAFVDKLDTELVV